MTSRYTLTLATLRSLPCGSRGGLGWGCMGFSVQPNVAMTSDNTKPCGNVVVLPLATLAPHPSPPLLPQGREPMVAIIQMPTLLEFNL